MFRETHYNQFNKNKAIIRDYIDGVTQCYLINTKGELINKFEPDVWADNIEDDNVIFAHNSKKDIFNGEALFDINGKQLTKFMYRTIFGGSEEGFFEVKNLEGNHGHIDKKGNEIIPCMYNDSGYFSEGLAPEKLHDNWGMVNWKNETIIPFIYQEISICHNNKISAKLNEKWGLIDKFNNKIIDFKYDEICNYLTRDSISIPVKISDKWGIIDVFGNTLFDFVFDDCDNLDKKDWYKFKKGNKWAIYNCGKNEFISDFIYDEVGYFSSGICDVKLNGKIDYVDKNNIPVSNFTYDYTELFYKTNLIEVNKNGKSGVINNGGKIIIPVKYKDKIKRISENMLVWEDDKFNQYVTDLNMNIIIPKQEHRRFYGGYSDGFIVAKDGYYDKNGNKLELKFEL